MDFNNKKIAVAGFGVEGKANAQYLAAHGAVVTVLDENPETSIDDYPLKTGPEVFKDLSEYDYVFRTAGLRPDKLNCPPEKILTAYKLLLNQRKQQIIGVTGTKGKGTTSSLIYHILKTAGEKVFLGGNIGVHPFDFYDNITDEASVVLELSSFQLMDVTSSPHGAVVLMIEPDHLDWHTDFKEYISAKHHIVTFQDEYDLAVYNPNNPGSAQVVVGHPGALPYLTGTQAHISQGYVNFGSNRVISVKQVGLRGPHNLENICAAVTICWYWLTEKGYDQAAVIAALKTAIKEFKGLPDRLETLATIKGVTYVNDTFSASPMALRAALNSFEEPKVVIVGGYDKGLGTKGVVSSLVERIESIKHILLIGQTAPAIALALRSANIAQFTNLGVADSMAEIVEQAAALAEPGDVVLLSPGHASFDMFKDYKDRGQQFRKAVNHLKS